MAASGNGSGDRRPPPRTSGLLFGFGLGGFVDGIVLHQVLHWHHMVSSVDDAPTDTVVGLELNTLASTTSGTTSARPSAGTSGSSPSASS